MKNIYLDRYAYPGPAISRPPRSGTGMIVVIPCYNETEVLLSLNSLYNCSKPGCEVEIIVVVNHGEDVAEHIKRCNEDTAQKVALWAKDHIKYPCHVIRAYDLKPKKAGVGLARKIGMDEAVRRFETLNEKNGIIVCFDADCLCSTNYLEAIYKNYARNPETRSALVYFEHLTGEDTLPEIKSTIVSYEIHLRYYVRALEMANYPFAYHTVGSCITVTSETYQKYGGMNQRKAGEDFYFLHKIFPGGNISNITDTTVFPSPRISERVPFGTGKAIIDILKNPETEYVTYNPKIFFDLKSLIDAVGKIWGNSDIGKIMRDMPESIANFLQQINFAGQIQKLKKNSSNEAQFKRAFYGWFNGFLVLKFVHFARDHYFPNVSIMEAANWVLNNYYSVNLSDKYQALNWMRKLDRSTQ